MTIILLIIAFVLSILALYLAVKILLRIQESNDEWRYIAPVWQEAMDAAEYYEREYEDLAHYAEFIEVEMLAMTHSYQNLKALTSVLLVMSQKCQFCGYLGDSEEPLSEYPGTVGYWHYMCYRDWQGVLGRPGEAEEAYMYMEDYMRNAVEDPNFTAQTPEGGEL